MRTVPTDRPGTWSIEEYLLLGETTTPCELINGNVVMSPSPNANHQEIINDLGFILNVETKKIDARVYPSAMDVIVDRYNVLQPDLIVLLRKNRHLVTSKGIEGAPDIVIEVISPATKINDRIRKLKIYLRMGVGEYWIIDPRKKSLEIFTPLSGEERPTLYVQDKGEVTSSVLPSLKFDLSEIFEDLAPL